MNAEDSATVVPAYPLQSSPNRRYLVDRCGAPFLVHGDAAWSLITALTREETGMYLADRARKGFNSLIVNLIEHKFNGPLNRDGEGPFTRPGDLTTPNERYFQHVDWVLHKAGEYGIQLFLSMLYLGYAGTDEGWIEEVLATGVEGCRQWGRYVGRRYGSYDNLIWLVGADRDPGEALPHVNATVEGIREHDTRHLFTAGDAPERPPLTDFPWVTLNNAYTYGIIHRQLLDEYNRRPVMPFVLTESTYEGEHNASAVQIRRQAYWAILCGACGQFMGNLPLWGFYAAGSSMGGTQFGHNEGHDGSTICTGWQAALDGQASRDMAHVKALFGSRPWFGLVPDQKHEVVTRGLGEFRGLDYLAAAETTDGSTVIAYMPTARAITVEMSRLCGKTVKAWWFDPRTGEAQAIDEYPADDPREFVPPADGDWVLVLDDARLNWPPPGQRHC